jgi:hypothetical protein
MASYGWPASFGSPLHGRPLSASRRVIERFHFFEWQWEPDKKREATSTRNWARRNRFMCGGREPSALWRHYMQLSQLPRQMLTYFNASNLKAGARVTLRELDSCFGSDPSLTVAVSELVSGGYLTAADANAVELTARGVRAAQQVARS